MTEGQAHERAQHGDAIAEARRERGELGIQREPHARVVEPRERRRSGGEHGETRRFVRHATRHRDAFAREPHRRFRIGGRLQRRPEAGQELCSQWAVLRRQRRERLLEQTDERAVDLRDDEHGAVAEGRARESLGVVEAARDGRGGERRLAPERRLTGTDPRRRELEQEIALRDVAPRGEGRGRARQEVDRLLVREVTPRAIGALPRPPDRLVDVDERGRREQMVHGLGDRGVRIVPVAREERATHAQVEVRSPGRRQVVIEDVADQDVRERRAVGGIDEDIAAHGLAGEIADGGEVRVDERGCDRQVERSPENGRCIEERSSRRRQEREPLADHIADPVG